MKKLLVLLAVLIVPALIAAGLGDGHLGLTW